MITQSPQANPAAIRIQLTEYARTLGFADIGITGIALDEDERHLDAWIDSGWHGQMQYMARHGTKRTRPAQLLPGTVRVISARMNYWPRRGKRTPNRCWAIRNWATSPGMRSDATTTD